MIWGLIIPNGSEWKPVSLLSTDVEARIIDFCAEVDITQTYCSEIASSDAVRIGDTVTVAEIKKKEEARQTYNSAVARGDSAQLLEQKRGDVFQMRVGNLRPNELCTVKISYVADLKVEGDDVLFLLPTAVAPRYNPASERDPLVQTGALHGQHGLSIRLRMQMGSAITTVRSETHTIRFTGGAGDARRGEAVLGQQYTHLEKDFVALVGTALPHAPRVCIETSSEGSRVAMVTLVPQFDLPDCKCEFVFVVDRSGSMQGAKIDQARSAMQLFLRSLPADCFFNIVGFGNNFQKLFPESRRYDQASLQKATGEVARLQAVRARRCWCRLTVQDLGGTEILAPLQAVMGAHAVAGYARQVFVLTDGEVSNTKEVINFVARSHHSRVFALGLGEGASHELVEGIARAGRGTALFVISNDSLDRKVIQQLRDSMMPSLNDVALDWGFTAGPVPAAGPAPVDEGLRGGVSVSLHAHPLYCVPCPYPTGQWQCDRCSKTSGADVHHCPTCSYDLCDQCMNWAVSVEGSVKQSGGIMAATRNVMGSLLGFTAEKKKPAATFTQAPALVPPIFSKSRFLVFCMVPRDAPSPSRVTVTANTPAGKLQVTLEARPEDYVAGDTLHRLAARTRIRDLEQLNEATMDKRQFRSEEAKKAEILALSLKHHIASSEASFVAVQRRSDGAANVLPYVDMFEAPPPPMPSMPSYAGGASCGGGPGMARMMMKCKAAPVTRCAAPSAKPQALSTRLASAPAPTASASASISMVASEVGMDAGVYDADVLAFLMGGMSPELCHRRKAAQQAKKMESRGAAPERAMDSNLGFSAEEECDASDSSDGGHQDLLDCAPLPQRNAKQMQPPKSAPSADYFMDLILGQQFDGRFKLNSVLATVLGVTVDALKTASAVAGKPEGEDIWATALTIAVLLKKYANRKDESELIIGKANKWLATVAVDAKEVHARAAEYVASVMQN